jgi:hypothetical protein
VLDFERCLGNAVSMSIAPRKGLSLLFAVEQAVRTLGLNVTVARFGAVCKTSKLGQK